MTTKWFYAQYTSILFGMKADWNDNQQGYPFHWLWWWTIADFFQFASVYQTYWTLQTLQKLWYIVRDRTTDWAVGFDVSPRCIFIERVYVLDIGFANNSFEGTLKYTIFPIETVVRWKLFCLHKCLSVSDSMRALTLRLSCLVRLRQQMSMAQCLYILRKLWPKSLTILSNS